MKAFEPNKPLVFIDVPSCANGSMRAAFRKWFGDRLHERYCGGDTEPVLDLKMQLGDGVPVVCGCFDRRRGLGLEYIFPEVSQFVTILRDPLDIAISSYLLACRLVGSTPSSFGLIDYAISAPLDMLNHFPREVTFANFEEQIERWFIGIGVVENLEGSMVAIANHLGQDPGNAPIAHMDLNPHEVATPYGLRDALWERWPLEHAVYDYVAKRHGVRRPLEIF